MIFPFLANLSIAQIGLYVFIVIFCVLLIIRSTYLHNTRSLFFFNSFAAVVYFATLSFFPAFNFFYDTFLILTVLLNILVRERTQLRSIKSKLWFVLAAVNICSMSLYFCTTLYCMCIGSLFDGYDDSPIFWLVESLIYFFTIPEA